MDLVEPDRQHDDLWLPPPSINQSEQNVFSSSFEQISVTANNNSDKVKRYGNDRVFVIL